MPSASNRKRLYLRASIKLVLTIGFLFLLIPFCSSVFNSTTEPPADGVLIQPANIREGHTQRIQLSDGSFVFVTRSSAALQAALQQTPADALWYTTAPGLLQAAWWVVATTSATGLEVSYQPADSQNPAHFSSSAGQVWDLAGRALKPGALNPNGSAVKSQNLLPMPYRRFGDGILLLPLPPAKVPETSSP